MPRPDKKTKPRGQANNSQGNQAYIAGGTFEGDVNIDQRFFDNSQSTTIINNINNPSNASTPSNDGLKLFFLGMAALVSIVLFVTFHPLLHALANGTAIAVGLLVTIAIVRTQRMKAWTWRAGFTAVVAIASAALTGFVWKGITTLDRAGLTLGSAGASFPQIGTTEPEKGVIGYVSHFITVVLPAFDRTSDSTKQFIIVLMIAAIAATGLIVLAWLSLLEWFAYLRFINGSKQSRRVTAKAKSFTEDSFASWAAYVLSVAILASIAIICSNGVAYDFWLSSPQPQLVPSA